MSRLRGGRMKVYVSSSSADLVKARLVMNLIRRHGHIVTCDWTTDAEIDPRTPYPHEAVIALVDNARKSIAISDALIALAPITSGCLVEIGIALAYLCPVYVVGRWQHFFAARCLHYPVLLEAITAMEKYHADHTNRVEPSE